MTFVERTSERRMTPYQLVRGIVQLERRLIHKLFDDALPNLLRRPIRGDEVKMELRLDGLLTRECIV